MKEVRTIAVFKKIKKKTPLGDITMGIDLISEILEKTDEEMAQMNPVNVLLIGKTGVGKSTLINQIFRENLAKTGIGAPVTEHLIKISKPGMPLNLYDTKGLELSLESQKTVQSEVMKTIEDQEAKQDIREVIHCIWFCISALSGRLEETEKIWIQALSQRLPVIVVLTQAIDRQAARELEQYIKKECPQIKGCIPVVAKDYKIESYNLRSYGLKDLMERTLANLPEEARRAFINAQRVDLEKKAQEARRWAKRFVYETFAVGFIPIPFADAPIIAASQATMLAKITAIFGVSYDQAMITSLVGAMAGIGGAVVTGRTLTTNLLKLIPGAGMMVAGAISGSTAAAITMAMSTIYINVLKEVCRQEYDGKKILPEEIRLLVDQELKRVLPKK